MNDQKKIFIFTRVVLSISIIFVFSIFISYVAKEIVNLTTGKRIFAILMLLLPFATFLAVRNVDKSTIYSPKASNLKMQKLQPQFWMGFKVLLTIGYLGNLLLFYIASPILGFLYYSYSDYKLNFERK